uniref:Uncharacterized protein n=1 Tax=Rhizophora mucronata TaxID=61149 RepID=A0A2P2PSX1_RHIMU
METRNFQTEINESFLGKTILARIGRSLRL